MDRIENLTFAENAGESFRLETRLDATNQYHYSLYRNGMPVGGPNSNKMILILLRYLAKRRKRILYEEDIRMDIWPNSTDPGIVEKYISLARARALGQRDGNKETIIKTHRNDGYEFILDVKVEGDLDSIEAFSKWDRPTFYELINDVRRGRELEEKEDLRIATTAISSGLRELDLEGLIKRGVRIKILLMDPRDEALMIARHSRRLDKGVKVMERVRREALEQIEDLEELARKYPPLKPKEATGSGRNSSPVPVGNTGSLEFRLSRSMPCGCVIHSKHWAIVGLLLAHTTYVDGPMIQIDSASEAWEHLYRDWKARWPDDPLKA